jgi:hypothetical protein
MLDPISPGNVPRTGVFVHVESHEMRDVESLGENLQADNNVVVIPGTSYGDHTPTKETSFSSLSDTYDHKASAV